MDGGKMVFTDVFSNPLGGVDVVKYVETPVVPNESGDGLELGSGEGAQPVVVPQPLTELALVDAWRRVVTNEPKGSFARLLQEWVDARLAMNCAVNPGTEDPNTRRSRKPTKDFQRRLEEVFKQIRATQRKS